MKKLISFLIIVGIGLFFLTGLQDLEFTSGSEENNLYEEIIEENKYYYSDKDKGIKFIEFINFSEINLIDNKDLIPTEDFNNGNTIINAGYFLPDKSHAGFLFINGEEKVPLSFSDNQVTHIVEISDSIYFLTKDEILNNKAKNASTYFQTGPLIIRDNEIQHTLIENSVNGNSDHRRSVLGVTSEGSVFFLATSKTYSLKELSEIILTIPSLSNKTISAINLDGGSSVSLYSNENKEFRIGAAKKLPFLISIN